MKQQSFIALLSVLILVSCQKDKWLEKYPGLPDATRTGSNTAGCLLNGEVWVADKDYFWADRAVYAQYGDNHSIGKDQKFILRLDREISFNDNELEIDERINITLKPLKNVGKQKYSNFEKFEIEFGAINKGKGVKIYALDTRVEPFLNITRLDTVKKVISGTFDFRLKERDDINDTIRLSKGRFDAFYFPG